MDPLTAAVATAVADAIGRWALTDARRLEQQMLETRARNAEALALVGLLASGALLIEAHPEAFDQQARDGLRQVAEAFVSARSS